MKMKLFPVWRGLTVRLFAVTVLPLTLLLLSIAFGSVWLHQNDMRALVGERDERAVQAAAAAIESELHHRMSGISNLAAFAGASGSLAVEKSLANSHDFAGDFDGGVAFLADGDLIGNQNEDVLWNSIVQDVEGIRLASGSDPGPVISAPYQESASRRTYVIVSAYIASLDVVVAGAFTPDSLALQTLAASFPEDSQATIYLLDSTGTVLFVGGTSPGENLPTQQLGVTEPLQGERGTRYVQVEGGEHVLAYSSIPVTGWVLVTEEDWRALVTPSLAVTQMAPFVLVPAFILALLALWFGARQIVQPLQRLESKAAALAWGDFETIKEPVGGISEVQHLQKELVEMANKVQASQEGLHDYIGAITAAQEEERTRLARELHDDTIQAVIALKQRVQLAKKSVRDQNGRQSLKALENLAEQTVENLRRLTRALRPIYLEDLGLVTALEMLAQETGRGSGVEVEFQHSGQERRLSRPVELALYRIAQEALNNVLRHANASHASLSIAFEKEVRLEITDNGAGFALPPSPAGFAPSGHFGLLGIRERAELIGARLELQSEPGRGTRLCIRLSDPSSNPSRKKLHPGS